MFSKIIGFKNKKDSETIRSQNSRDFDEYTTIGEGFKFARSNLVSKFLVESWNFSCVDRTRKDKTEDMVISLKYIS
jgi:hypothetical protein